MEYLTVPDVEGIHEDILSEYPETDRGVRSVDTLEYTVQMAGYGAEEPSIHRVAADLLRLLVANHPFVDANKRTALNSVSALYLMNGYVPVHGAEMRGLLRKLATSVDDVPVEGVVEYLRSITSKEYGQSLEAEFRLVMESPGVREVASAHRSVYRDVYDALENE